MTLHNTGIVSPAYVSICDSRTRKIYALTISVLTFKYKHACSKNTLVFQKHILLAGMFTTAFRREARKWGRWIKVQIGRRDGSHIQHPIPCKIMGTK